MSVNALQSLESELDRLERQRLGYALALASSSDDKARARHERTLARLDEEIEALSAAAQTLADVTASQRAIPSPDGGVPIVDRTTEMDAETYDELAQPKGPRAATWITIGAAALAVAALSYWLFVPAAPTTAPSTTAPAAVTR